MKLQALQMTKQQGGDWNILNGEQEQMLSLTGKLSDGEIISIVEFAKSHEKLAFNEGKEFGSHSMRAAAAQRIDELTQRITSLEFHNGMLAEKVEQLIGGDLH